VPLFVAVNDRDSQGGFSMASIVAFKAGDTNVLIAVRRNPNDVTPVANIDDT